MKRKVRPSKPGMVILKLLDKKIRELNHRMVSNIEADLLGLPLPYPPPKPKCPHCGKEIGL